MTKENVHEFRKRRKLLSEITELILYLIWRLMNWRNTKRCTGHVYQEHDSKVFAFSINLKLKIFEIVNLFIWVRNRLFQSKFIFMSTTDLQWGSLFHFFALFTFSRIDIWILSQGHTTSWPLALKTMALFCCLSFFVYLHVFVVYLLFSVIIYHQKYPCTSFFVLFFFEIKLPASKLGPIKSGIFTIKKL